MNIDYLNTLHVVFMQYRDDNPKLAAEIKTEAQNILDECFSYSDKLTSLEQEYLRNGEKIRAIRNVRQRLGLPLKEAKEFVERFND